MPNTPGPGRPRPALDPAPWLPDAWGTPSIANARPDARPNAPPTTSDDFVAGWDVMSDGGAPPEAGAGAALGAVDAPGALDALLPDFGYPTRRRGDPARGDHARAADAARAADVREAAVRAELTANFAAELEAREMAHALALDEVWREGHAAGVAAGEAAAHEALADSARALDAAVHEVRTHEERWMGDLRAHVAALAVAVAHHVVGRAVAADDALVVALAARAVAEFPTAEALVARVHPADLDALKAAWESVPREGAVRWMPDARMVRGGTLVEGRERIVDGRVDAALERLYRALAGHVA